MRSRRRDPGSLISIQWKLPLVFTSLLLAVAILLAGVAYREVLAADRDRAEVRLRNLANQFAERYAQQTRSAIANARTIGASSPDLLGFLRTRTTAARDSLVIHLKQAARPSTAAVTILDASGNEILDVPRRMTVTADVDAEEIAAAKKGGVVGRLHVQADTVVVPAIVEIVDEQNTAVGYLVAWLPIEMSAATRASTARMLDAEVLVGSPGPPPVWTDLASLVEPPRFDVRDTARLHRSYAADGHGYVATSAPVAGGLWFVVVRSSAAAAFAPSRRLLRRTGITAFAVILIGAIVSWWLGRRLAQPLSAVRDAAAALSAGDYSRRVPVTSADEVGQLARVFNEMAQRIQSAHEALEGTVAELKRTQEQFIGAQRLEAVAHLAGGVAHDFNNLLTVTIGEAEMALEELPPGHPARASVQEIIEAGNRAAGLTRQLLAFSRRQLIEPTVFDVNALIAQVHAMLERLIGEDIEMVLRLAPAPLMVHADRGQIEQVIANLVVNARDAMPRGGRITIETGAVGFETETEGSVGDRLPLGEYVTIAVRDTGSGMSAEVRARVFEPFFTTKAVGKGTGLGLATSYGIAKQNGGDIVVESQEGFGTTMRLFLPRVHDMPAETRDVRRQESTGSETVLLVEDEEGVRRVTARSLRTYGYAVLEAASGDEAVRIAGSKPNAIDLLVTDVVLPGMGGRAVAEHVARVIPGIKVLYMSGYTGDVVVRHQLLEEDIALLQKPFTAEGLARKVRDVLDHA